MTPLAGITAEGAVVFDLGFVAVVELIDDCATAVIAAIRLNCREIIREFRQTKVDSNYSTQKIKGACRLALKINQLRHLIMAG